MRNLILAAVFVGAFAAAPALAQPADGAAPAASAALTTAATPLGDLLDNHAARAVLDKHVPEMVSSPQIEMARGMTLKSLQAYAPNLTDEKLAAIDADLAALSAS